MQTKMERIVKKIENCIETEFYDISQELSEVLEAYDELQSELDDANEALKDLETSIEEEMECPTSIYTQLKELGASLQLSDSNYHQDEILKILQSEFNINLIVAPQRNA